MSYTALYRKWRPDTFSDVKGQEHIVRTLKNQIESDRVGHAYLFCGTRGTGKTTIAKILAKAVNCEHPIDGSPCGECAVCKAIANGSSLNVIEIDAASNNGVDNIRQIRDEVAYRPTEGRYKVYIIDEVHMLSIGAFNALLKTLEEPPSYVIFILATTEVHKIPVTIMSRCQRYDFKRISVDTIEARLRELVDKEGALAEEKALRYIAKLADGAMRDALSLLDQCMAVNMNGELKYEDVLETLGTVDTEIFSKILRDIINENVPELIAELEELILQGRDLGQFVSDFTWYVRNILVVKTTENAGNMIDMSEENLERLKEEAYAITEEQAMRYIRILSELSAGIRYATQKRVLVEVALIKMTRPQMETDITSITERLKRVEELVREKEDLLALSAIRPVDTDNSYTAKPEPKTVVRHTVTALPEDIKAVVKNWNGIIGQADNIYNAYLKKMRITAVDDRLTMVAEDDFTYRFMKKEEHLNYIRQIIENTIGKEVPVEVTLLDEGADFNQSFTDLKEFIKMDVEEE